MSLLMASYAQNGVRAAPFFGLFLEEQPLTVVREETVNIPVQVFRENGYTPTVTLATSSLPTGVTAAWPDGDTVPVGVTTRTLQLSAAANAELVTAYEIIVTATGANFPVQTASTFLTVAEGPPDTPAISITSDPTSATILQGGVRDFLVTLVRDAFTSTVTLTTLSLPAGATASFPDGDTFTEAATTRRVRVTVAGNASAVIADAWTIRASGSGVSNSDASMTLTINDAPVPSAFTPNLNPEYTVVVDEGFAATNLPTAWGKSNLNAGAGILNSDVSGPYGSRSLIVGPNGQNALSAGSTGIFAGAFWLGSSVANMPATGYRRLFVAWATQFGPVDGSGAMEWGYPGAKWFYPIRKTATGTTPCHVFVPMLQSGVWKWVMFTQGPAGTRILRYYNQNGYSSTNPYPVEEHVWYRMQAEWVCNTPGVSDGVFRLWMSTYDADTSVWSAYVLVTEALDVTYCYPNDPGYWTGPQWFRHYFQGAGSTMPSPVAEDSRFAINKMVIAYGDPV